MLAVVLHIWGFIASLQAAITVRNFSLVTDKGVNVFQADSGRRRLQDSAMDRIVLKFSAVEKIFEFQFESSHQIFSSKAVIEIIGRVCENNMKAPIMLHP